MDKRSMEAAKACKENMTQEEKSFYDEKLQQAIASAEQAQQAESDLLRNARQLVKDIEAKQQAEPVGVLVDVLVKFVDIMDGCGNWPDTSTSQVELGDLAKEAVAAIGRCRAVQAKPAHPPAVAVPENQQMLAEVVALLESHQKWLNKLPVPTKGATHQMMHVVGKAISILGGMKSSAAVPDADWLTCFAKEVQQATEATLVVIDTEGGGPDLAVAEVIARYAAQSVAVPEGYALVPIEPTEDMIDAAREAAINWPDGFPNHAEGYRAMLAAAPQADVGVSVHELQAILNDRDAHPPTHNSCCEECGSWTPWNHPEAHDHKERCTAPAKYAKRRDWAARLSALIAAAQKGGA